jgi:hypothetical protein
VLILPRENKFIFVHPLARGVLNRRIESARFWDGLSWKWDEQ